MGPARETRRRPFVLAASLLLLLLAILVVPVFYASPSPTPMTPGSPSRVTSATTAAIASSPVTLDKFPIILFHYYYVVFVESGLPSGSVWSVNFNGIQYNNTTTALGGEINTTEVNGTYALNVSGPSAWWGAPAPAQVTVHGSDVTLPLAFVQFQAVWLTIQEKGLARGITWGAHSLGVEVNRSTSGSSLAVLVPNGTQVTFGALPPADYGLYEVLGSSSLREPVNNHFSMNVSGVSRIQLVFHLLVAVTIQETGLPSGVNWQVTLRGTAGASWSVDSGAINSSTSTTFTAIVPFGRYAYTATSLNAHYVAVPSHGDVGVPVLGVTKSIPYHLVTSKVTFHALGLPRGISFGMEINGPMNETYTGHGPAAFYLEAGVYGFNITGYPIGYEPIPTNGTFQIYAPLAFSVYIVWNPVP